MVVAAATAAAAAAAAAAEADNDSGVSSSTRGPRLHAATPSDIASGGDGEGGEEEEEPDGDEEEASLSRSILLSTVIVRERTSTRRPLMHAFAAVCPSGATGGSNPEVLSASSKTCCSCSNFSFTFFRTCRGGEPGRGEGGTENNFVSQEWGGLGAWGSKRRA